MKDALICIAAGKSQIPIIMAAKSLGYIVIAVDMDPNAPGFSHVDGCVTHSTHDASGVIKALESLNHQISEKYRWVGVLNRSSGPPVVTVSKICEHFGIPGVPITSAQMLLNKDVMREACTKFSIPSPYYQLLNKHQIPILTADLYPVVIKPALSMIGKSGISIVRSEEELSIAIEYASTCTINEKLILEKYIPGADYSFISFVESGEVHCICMLDEINLEDADGRVFGKGFKTHAPSKNHNFEKMAGVISGNIVRSLNIIRSPFMVSFRSDLDGNLFLMEVHLDMGGDLLIEKLFPSALKINFQELAVQMAVGKVNFPLLIEVYPSAVIFDEGSGLVSEKSCKVITTDTQGELEALFNE